MITAAEGSPLATVPTNEGKEVAFQMCVLAQTDMKPLLVASTRRVGLL